MLSATSFRVIDRLASGSPLHDPQTAGAHFKPDVGPWTRPRSNGSPSESFSALSFQKQMPSEGSAANHAFVVPAESCSYTTHPVLNPLPLNHDWHTSRRSL
ncbi:hypothetical protein BKA66DRAFT_454930 [Pyrenochaeta sp. MPI-SDFR-AT-0127]|nr:hypothetical protein BKA66DRAFT_454930 [Pyrenochaeta sp. MPI-SDFR-AT-0127]